MPEMNGIQATKKIKALVQSTYREDIVKEHLKIVAVSAQEENTIEEGFVFDSYLSKPVDLNKLKNLLEKYRF